MSKSPRFIPAALLVAARLSSDEVKKVRDQRR